MPQEEQRKSAAPAACAARSQETGVLGSALPLNKKEDLSKALWETKQGKMDETMPRARSGQTLGII